GYTGLDISHCSHVWIKYLDKVETLYIDTKFHPSTMKTILIVCISLALAATTVNACSSSRRSILCLLNHGQIGHFTGGSIKLQSMEENQICGYNRIFFSVCIAKIT
ncbi:hypothetical protein RRG08_065062, partial [Elysia crispata]